ncbi:hypothetical protein O3M35_008973 [Rhynocoris fuscipes]|uniref:Uncharacterized protein n=1 Tax=Rhynocoris fuscipes TaxID=488301 RepID=A0AAW1D2J6_9HEMI
MHPGLKLSCTAFGQLCAGKLSIQHALGDQALPQGVVRGLLESRGFTCFNEVYAVDTEGTSRYADIVAFDCKSDLAYVLDSTVRFESNEDHLFTLTTISQKMTTSRSFHCLSLYQQICLHVTHFSFPYIVTNKNKEVKKKI